MKTAVLPLLFCICILVGCHCVRPLKVSDSEQSKRASATLVDPSEIYNLEQYRKGLRDDTKLRLWPSVLGALDDQVLLLGGSFRTPAASCRSALLISRDGGRTWKDTAVWRTGGKVVDIDVLDKRHAWVLTEHSIEGDMGPYHVWRTSDAGRSWKRCGTELPLKHIGIDWVESWSFQDARTGEIVVAGTMGERLTYQTVDGGQTWKETKAEVFEPDGEEGSRRRKPQRVRAEVDLKADVILIQKSRQLGEQAFTVGELEHQYLIRPEPLFLAAVKGTVTSR